MLRARESGIPVRPQVAHHTLPRGRALAGGLALALLALSSCQASSAPQATKGSTISPDPSVSAPSSRNHVSPGMNPLFVSITFTPATSYDQAVALVRQVGTTPYPWTCDAPRMPVPPSEEQLRAAFASSHQLFLSYPEDDQLNQLATFAQVLSVDPTALYMCP